MNLIDETTQPKSDLTWLWIVLGIAGAILLLALIAFIIRFTVNKKKVEKKPEVQSLKKAKDFDFDLESIIASLGGKENVLGLELHGSSRLFVKLNDMKIVDKEKLNSLGIRTLEMSEQLVLVNENADILYNKLNSL
jgi:phosphotransferase system IIB component